MEAVHVRNYCCTATEANDVVTSMKAPKLVEATPPCTEVGLASMEIGISASAELEFHRFRSSFRGTGYYFRGRGVLTSIEVPKCQDLWGIGILLTRGEGALERRA